MKKCKTKDCNNFINKAYRYCSIECACYDGKFSVRKGVKMYDKIKECVWEAVEPYYNTGEDYIFTFEGGEEGLYWIKKVTTGDIITIPYIPLKHIDEFVEFVKFVKQHIKEWQESEEGKKRIKEIEQTIT